MSTVRPTPYPASSSPVCPVSRSPSRVRAHHHQPRPTAAPPPSAARTPVAPALPAAAAPAPVAPPIAASLAPAAAVAPASAAASAAAAAAAAAAKARASSTLALRANPLCRSLYLDRLHPPENQLKARQRTAVLSACATVQGPGATPHAPRGGAPSVRFPTVDFQPPRVSRCSSFPLPPSPSSSALHWPSWPGFRDALAIPQEAARCAAADSSSCIWSLRAFLIGEGGGSSALSGCKIHRSSSSFSNSRRSSSSSSSSSSNGSSSRGFSSRESRKREGSSGVGDESGACRNGFHGSFLSGLPVRAAGHRITCSRNSSKPSCCARSLSSRDTRTSSGGSSSSNNGSEGSRCSSMASLGYRSSGGARGAGQAGKRAKSSSTSASVAASESESATADGARAAWMRVRVGAADRRHFANPLPDFGSTETDTLPLPSQQQFLDAGLALAQQAVEGMEREALANDGPFLYTGLLGAALLCLRCHEAVTSAGNTTASAVGGSSASASGATTAAGYEAGGAQDYLGRAARIVRACERSAARHKTYFSFFCGQPGIHAVGAAVAAAQGDVAEAERHMKALNHFAEDPRLLARPATMSASSSDDDDGPVDPAPGGVPYELLYGRAGFLWAALFANHACAKAELPRLPTLVVPAQRLSDIAAATVAGGRAMAAEDCRDGRPSLCGTASQGNYPPLMHEWHGQRYLGAAHGLAGVVHTLLLFLRRREQEALVGLPLAVSEGDDKESGTADVGLDVCVLDDMEGTVRYLIAHRFPSGNFPTSEEKPERDERVHWCHGAPGVALTLIAFANAFPMKADYLKAAEEASDLVWQRGLLRRVGLCHGVSGNAYVFLALHRCLSAAELHAAAVSPHADDGGDATRARLRALRHGADRQLHRARMFGALLMWRWRDLVESGEMHPGDSPYSLMEGLAGPACLMLDLAHPSASRFPGYEM